MVDLLNYRYAALDQNLLFFEVSQAVTLVSKLVGVWLFLSLNDFNFLRETFKQIKLFDKILFLIR